MSQPRPLRSTSSPLGSAAESAATVPEPHIRIWHSSKSSLTAPDDRKQIQRAFCKIRPVAGFFYQESTDENSPLPPEKPSRRAALFHGGLGPLRKLFLGNVLDVRADRPHVAEGIGQRSGTVSVELIL